MKFMYLICKSNLAKEVSYIVPNPPTRGISAFA